MLWHYFITLDRTLSNTPPTMLDFYTLLSEICDCYTFFPITPYPIHSIEFKQKGSIRRNTKIYNYPHYHCIVGSWSKTQDFTSAQFKKYGWSIHIKHLSSPRDLITTAGYIYKGHKPDPITLCNSNYQKSVISAGDRVADTNNRLDLKD